MKLIAFVLPFLAVAATIVGASTHMKSPVHHQLAMKAEEPVPSYLAQTEGGCSGDNSLACFVDFIYHKLKKLEEKVEFLEGEVFEQKFIIAGFKEEFHTEQLFIVGEQANECDEVDEWVVQIEGDASLGYRALVIRDLTQLPTDNRFAFYEKSLGNGPSVTFGTAAGSA